MRTWRQRGRVTGQERDRVRNVSEHYSGRSRHMKQLWRKGVMQRQSRARQSELERKEGRERKGGPVAECRSGGRYNTVGHMNLKYAYDFIHIYIRLTL